MPTVNGKKFSYDAAGMRAAAAARKAKGNPTPQVAPSVPKPRPMRNRLSPKTASSIARATRPTPSRLPRTKGDLSGKGYNIARNINGGKLPDVGY